MLNFKNVCIILRGTSNCGKSSLAEYIGSLFDSCSSEFSDGKSCSICTADDHFTNKDGKYNFISSELGTAHRKCKEKFLKALFAASR